MESQTSRFHSHQLAYFKKTQTKMKKENIKQKSIKQELKENYEKGGLIVCGVEEMVRFIKKILKRHHYKITHPNPF